MPFSFRIIWRRCLSIKLSDDKHIYILSDIHLEFLCYIFIHVFLVTWFWEWTAKIVATFIKPRDFLRRCLAKASEVNKSVRSRIPARQMSPPWLGSSSCRQVHSSAWKTIFSNDMCSEPSREDTVVEVVCPVWRRREGAMGTIENFHTVDYVLRSDSEVKCTD